MWDYIPAAIVGVIITIYTNIKKEERTSFDLAYFGAIIAGTFIIPLYEETIFRYALRNVLIDTVPYPMHLNALIFGVIHSANALLVKMTVSDVAISVTFTTYLGWVFLHKSFWYGFALHALHNGLIYTVRALCQYYVNRKIPTATTRTNVPFDRAVYIKKRHQSLSIPSKTDIYFCSHKAVDKKHRPEGSDKLEKFMDNYILSKDFILSE